MKLTKAERTALNQDGIDNPQVGDYWHEMFSPYFLVVDVTGDQITVLSCLSPPGTDRAKRGEPFARIMNKDDTWCFDYSKHFVVDREWIKDAVTYSYSTGFVADLVRGGGIVECVKEWHDENMDYVPVKPGEFKQYAEWWLGS